MKTDVLLFVSLSMCIFASKYCIRTYLYNSKPWFNTLITVGIRITTIRHLLEQIETFFMLVIRGMSTLCSHVHRVAKLIMVEHIDIS